METEIYMSHAMYEAIHETIRDVIMEEIRDVIMEEIDGGICIDTENCTWEGCNRDTILVSVALVEVVFDTGEYDFDF